MRTETNLALKTRLAHAFDIREVEGDIEGALRRVPSLHPAGPADYAPMPDYVEHRDGVSRVGALSAEAVVKEYEAAAVAVEAMGTELKARIAKLEATKADAVTALDEIKETAERYRDEGKRIFLQIEDCALTLAEVRGTCDALKTKIAGPSS
jgi:hypothetical protein